MAIKSVSAHTYENPHAKFQNSKNFSCSFGAKEKTQLKDKPEGDGEKYSKFTFKTATNVIGVIAWLGIVGFGAKKLKIFRPNSPERINEKAESLGKKIKSNIEICEDGNPTEHINEALKNSFNKGAVNVLYKLGSKIKNTELKQGKELFNNLIYMFGTVVVLPLSVLFSPIGKKQSSKEDKICTVLRQPISAASALGLQFTFDKLLKKYVPEVMKKNMLEDTSILTKDKDGKNTIKLLDEKGNFINENFEKIKYNAAEAKDGFKKLFEIDQNKNGLKNLLTKEEVNAIFTNRTYEDDASKTYKKRITKLLNDKYKASGLDLSTIDDVNFDDSLLNSKKLAPERKAKILSYKEFAKKHVKEALDIQKLASKFSKTMSVIDSNYLVNQKGVIWINVVGATVIGCTFLNVIYGKMIKGMKKNHILIGKTPQQPSAPDKKAEKEVK